MAQVAVLSAETREKTGTGVAKALRRQGKVPGIIYGGEDTPQPIVVDLKALHAEANKSGFFSRIYSLGFSKENVQVIARDIQMHPVTDTPIHVDFQRVTKDSKLHVSIPVEYINEDKAPGIKLGGLLNIIIHKLEVVCSPEAIPEKIVVDLAGLNINNSIHLESISLPTGVVAANIARDNTLVTIVPPSGAEEAEKTGDAGASDSEKKDEAKS